ncbi:hypothetical protein [Mucilaginibacter sp.]|uniref:hypothetical protein n=1 Tax=Mucilaginibacter sp. TaxID=1882438 RepID=UPI003D0E0D81
MDDRLKYKISLKSDEELQDYINNREKYLPETIELSVAELQARGIEFTDEELKVIDEDMQARRQLAETPSNDLNFFRYDQKNNQIEDPEAPSYYSKRAIYIFSILFSVFFGSIMLAMNVAKRQSTAKALLVVLFGLGVTAATIILGEEFNLPTSSGIFISIIGAYAMNAIFWKNYIGNNALYRLRPIWTPLAIGLCSAGMFVYMIVLSLGK